MMLTGGIEAADGKSYLLATGTPVGVLARGIDGVDGASGADGTDAVVAGAVAASTSLPGRQAEACSTTLVS